MTTQKLKEEEGKKLDFVFVCRKCDHNLYLTNGVNLTGRQIAMKLRKNCPNCGEETGDYWVGLWIYTRTGNYEVERAKP